MVERDDSGFDERWLNVDVEWVRPVPAEFRTSKQACDPARGHTYMIIGEHPQRFELALLPAGSSEDPEQPETASGLLGRLHGPRPQDARIVGSSSTTWGRPWTGCGSSLTSTRSPGSVTSSSLSPNKPDAHAPQGVDDDH